MSRIKKPRPTYRIHDFQGSVMFTRRVGASAGWMGQLAHLPMLIVAHWPTRGTLRLRQELSAAAQYEYLLNYLVRRSNEWAVFCSIANAKDGF